MILISPVCFQLKTIMYLRNKLRIFVSTHDEVWISVSCSPRSDFDIHWEELIPVDCWCHHYSSTSSSSSLLYLLTMVCFVSNHHRRRPTCTVTDWYTYSFIPREDLSATLEAFAAISVTTPLAKLLPIQNQNC